MFALTLLRLTTNFWNICILRGSALT